MALFFPEPGLDAAVAFSCDGTFRFFLFSRIPELSCDVVRWHIQILFIFRIHGIETQKRIFAMALDFATAATLLNRVWQNVVCSILSY